MTIDKSKRRAFLAFCMDALARSLSDEDVLPQWLTDGMPDGTYDEVPDSAVHECGAPYVPYVEDMSDEEWNALCACFMFTMMRGCFGQSEAIENMVYEDGSMQ